MRAVAPSRVTAPLSRPGWPAVMRAGSMPVGPRRAGPVGTLRTVSYDGLMLALPSSLLQTRRLDAQYVHCGLVEPERAQPLAAPSHALDGVHAQGAQDLGDLVTPGPYEIGHSLDPEWGAARVSHLMRARRHEVAG